MKALFITLQRTLDVMGLKSLHHSLLDAGHASRILFLPRFTPDSAAALEGVRNFVGAEAPDVIGIGLMAVEYHGAIALTESLKKAFPEIPVVWGGVHPTTSPEDCVPHADYVCVGEGEQSMIEMAEAIDAGGSLKTVRNFCYLEEGVVKRNPLYPLISDLDRLPYVEQISPFSFIQSRGAIVPVTPKELRRYMRFGTTVYNVISSRGCPYRCAYCSNSYYHKIYPSWSVRRRSVDHLLGELEIALEQYPDLHQVNFQDDCFLACSMDYLREFCVGYKARIGKSIIAKSTPTYVTPERIRMLKEAGLTWFNMGLQSGSERVCQEVYNRRSGPKHFIAAATVLHDYGIATWYDMIVDNPFESLEDNYQTVETLIATPKPFYPQIFSLTFYPMTDLRDRALAECPDLMEDPTRRDFYVYHNRPINHLIEVACTLPGGLSRALLGLHRRAPHASSTRMALALARLLCLVLMRPLTYFRVIKISQGGSLIRTLSVLPNYFKVGISVYLGLFPGQPGGLRPAFPIASIPFTGI